MAVRNDTNATEDVLMKPGGDTLSASIIVHNAPVHIIGGELPEGAEVKVYRIYSGPSDPDCVPIPEVPVWDHTGCSVLSLYNKANNACAGGRQIRNDIWLLTRGKYVLQYVAPAGDPTATEIPAGLFVYSIKDPLVKGIFSVDVTELA